MLNITDFIDIISNNIPNLELKQDVPMSRLTSFRIGGPARCGAFRSCPDPLGIVTAKQLNKLEFI